MKRNLEEDYSGATYSILVNVRKEMAIKKCKETKELLGNLGYSNNEIRELMDNILEIAS